MPDYRYAWIPTVGLVAGQPSLAVLVPWRASHPQAAALEEKVKQMELEDNYRRIKEEILADKESKRLDD